MLSGTLTGILRDPHIYSIVVGECLYIGQSQQLPIKRWADHLSPGGSLRTCLERAYEPFDEHRAGVSFVAAACTPVRDLIDSQRRLVTQYIEHRVHVICTLKLGRLTPIRRIVSSTVHTAPSYCRHSWADDCAMHVYDTFVAAWRSCGVLVAP